MLLFVQFLLGAQNFVDRIEMSHLRPLATDDG